MVRSATSSTAPTTARTTACASMARVRAGSASPARTARCRTARMGALGTGRAAQIIHARATRATARPTAACALARTTAPLTASVAPTARAAAQRDGAARRAPSWRVSSTAGRTGRARAAGACVPPATAATIATCLSPRSVRTTSAGGLEVDATSSTAASLSPAAPSQSAHAWRGGRVWTCSASTAPAPPTARPMAGAVTMACAPAVAGGAALTAPSRHVRTPPLGLASLAWLARAAARASRTAGPTMWARTASASLAMPAGRVKSRSDARADVASMVPVKTGGACVPPDGRAQTVRPAGAMAGAAATAGAIPGSARAMWDGRGCTASGARARADAAGMGSAYRPELVSVQTAGTATTAASTAAAPTAASRTLGVGGASARRGCARARPGIPATAAARRPTLLSPPLLPSTRHYRRRARPGCAALTASAPMACVHASRDGAASGASCSRAARPRR